MKACLDDEGAETSTAEDDLDLVASAAGVGGLHADFGQNAVTFAFERSEADAGRTEQAYELFDVGDDLLERQGTLVYLWDKTPTDAEAEAVDKCLSE